MTYDDLINNHDSDPLEEFRRDAFTPTFNDLEDFAEYHPLSEYEDEAVNTIFADGGFASYVESSEAILAAERLALFLVRPDLLGRNYATDQKVRDENLVRDNYSDAVRGLCEHKQREAWEA